MLLSVDGGILWWKQPICVLFCILEIWLEGFICPYTFMEEYIPSNNIMTLLELARLLKLVYLSLAEIQISNSFFLAVAWKEKWRMDEIMDIVFE